jgi:hypothetical protein
MRALYNAAFSLWTKECKIANVTPQSVLLPKQDAAILHPKSNNNNENNNQNMDNSNLGLPESNSPLVAGVSLGTRINSGGNLSAAMSSESGGNYNQSSSSTKPVARRNSLSKVSLAAAGKFKKVISNRRNSLGGV